MSKQIQVSDELHARLKGHADSNYRTLGNQIELLLDQSEGIMKNSPRTLGEHIHIDKPVSEYRPIPGQMDIFNDALMDEPRVIPIEG